MHVKPIPRSRAPNTITQPGVAPPSPIRDDLSLFAAGETMLEAVDRITPRNTERNVRVVLLLWDSGR